MTKPLLIGSLLAGMAGLSAVSAAAEEPIRFCTGGTSGAYFQVGHLIAKNTPSPYSVEVIATNGSLDNLQRLSQGECDVAIAQGDALHYSQNRITNQHELTRLTGLYKEVWHFICNKKTFKGNDAKDLQDEATYRIAVGPDGSGSYVAWHNLVQADKDYQKVAIDQIGGDEMLLRIADGGSDTVCGLYLAAAGAPFIAAGLETFGDVLELVDATDSDMYEARDSAGDPLYEKAKIKKKSFGNGYPKENITTPSVEAVLMYNNATLTGEAKKALLDAVVKSRGDIIQKFGGE